MKTVKITLDGQVYEVRELRRRKSLAWRKSLETPFSGLITALQGLPEAEITPGLVVGLVQQISGGVLGSVDTIVELVGEYAPELKPHLEDAYDSEIVEAFVAILGLAYPFGITGLVERVQTLYQIGSPAQMTTPNSPSRPGENLTTS